MHQVVNCYLGGLLQILDGYVDVKPDSTSADFSTTLPVTPSDGDLLVAVGWEYPDTIASTNTADGWVNVSSSAQTGAAGASLRIAYKVCTSSETATQEPFVAGDTTSQKGLTIHHLRSTATWASLYVGTNWNRVTSGATSVSTSRVVANANSIVLASCFYHKSSPTGTPGPGALNSGWTIINQDHDEKVSGLIAYQLRDAGSVTCDYSGTNFSGTLSSPGIVLVELKRSA